MSLPSADKISDLLWDRIFPAQLHPCSKLCGIHIKKLQPTISITRGLSCPFDGHHVMSVDVPARMSHSHILSIVAKWDPLESGYRKNPNVRKGGETCACLVFAAVKVDVVTSAIRGGGYHSASFSPVLGKCPIDCVGGLSIPFESVDIVDVDSL